MQVADIIQKTGGRIVSTEPGRKIPEVARILEQERVGAALVRGDGGVLLGILSERDIVRGLARHGPEALAMAASDLMTAPVIVCGPETDTEELMQRMLGSRIRHLPVVRDGTLLAVVSIGDVVNAVVGELRWMRTALQDQMLKSAVWSTEEVPD